MNKWIYKFNVWCCNCKTENMIEIPKGVTVEKYSHKLKCKYCGCKTLRK